MESQNQPYISTPWIKTKAHSYISKILKYHYSPAHVSLYKEMLTEPLYIAMPSASIYPGEAVLFSYR